MCEGEFEAEDEVLPLVGVCGGVGVGLSIELGFFRGGGALVLCMPLPWVLCRGELRPSVLLRVRTEGTEFASGSVLVSNDCFESVLSSIWLSLVGMSASGDSLSRLTANINFFWCPWWERKEEVVIIYVCEVKPIIFEKTNVNFNSGSVQSYCLF